jgi:hypothetical protein
MGNSSSFTLTLQQTTLPNSTNPCTNCVVAQLTAGAVAQSKVPGNIATINFASSNSVISQANNITVFSELFAPIPNGGVYQIALPASVQPILPVICTNVFAFTLTSTVPNCSYNATTNTIYTNNFIFSGIGKVVISVGVINPSDTTPAPYYFQTFDATGNMIGNSTTPYYFTATPLLLNAFATKNNSQVDTAFKLIVNCTLAVALRTTDKLQVILPAANYGNNILCYSAGTNIACTTSTDPVTGNLTISLAPPCSQCNIGSNLLFSIDNLMNPSIINSNTQSVIVQTTFVVGVVETVALNLNLTPSSLILTNYTRIGSSQIGSIYTMSFAYSIPPYVAINGGQLVILFNS